MMVSINEAIDKIIKNYNEKYAAESFWLKIGTLVDIFTV